MFWGKFSTKKNGATDFWWQNGAENISFILSSGKKASHEQHRLSLEGKLKRLPRSVICLLTSKDYLRANLWTITWQLNCANIISYLDLDVWMLTYLQKHDLRFFHCNALTCQPVRFKDAFRYTADKILFFSTHSKSIIKERHTLWSTYTWQKQCQRGRPDLFMMRSFINAIVILLSPLDVAILSFYEMSFFFFDN